MDKYGVTKGSFLVGNGTSAMEEKTSAEVLALIGATTKDEVYTRNTYTGDVNEAGNGLWWCKVADCTNLPVSSGYGVLTVAGRTQRFEVFHSQKTYTRTYANNQWYGWVRIDGIDMGHYFVADSGTALSVLSDNWESISFGSFAACIQIIGTVYSVFGTKASSIYGACILVGYAVPPMYYKLDNGTWTETAL